MLTKHVIADRLGYYDENGNYVTHRALIRKPHVSFSKRVRRTWHSLNKPREFLFTPGKGLRAIALIGLLGLGTVLLVDQALKLGEGTHLTSPLQQVIWQGTKATSTFDGWNTRLVSYRTSSPCTALLPCFRLDSNSTTSAVMISKTSFALDTVASHNLNLLGPDWFDDSPGVGTVFGFFLTRNSTIPNEIPNYNPVDDPEVALVVELEDQGGTPTLGSFSFIQREPSQSITSGDPTGCKRGGTVFVCGSTTLWDFNANGGQNFWQLVLNFTGRVNTAGQEGASVLAFGTALTGDTCAATTHKCSFDLPWLQFQGQQYYLGYFIEASSDGILDLEADTFTGQILREDYLIGSTGVDTGGFFGPLVRVLITIIDPVLKFLASVLAGVADAFVDGMDAVGRAFGLGNIGTAIRDALVGVGTWITNVFGTIFGQAINIATAIANALSAAVQVTGTYWTQLTSWLSAMSDLLSLFWPFIAFFGVGLPFSALMTYWLIQGIIMSYNSRDGALQWMRWTWILTATLFNIMWAIGERAFDVILKTKQLLAQWL